MKKEIGGDYWLEESSYENVKRELKDIDIKKHLQLKKDYISEFFNIDGKEADVLFCGRTAMDKIITDMLEVKDIKIAYLPSYCCSSMVQPFIDREIKVEFYNVYYDKYVKYDIDYEFKCDVFLCMNYFGFSKYLVDNQITEFKSRNIFVIEDCTQSYLNESYMISKSDYQLISLRKWTAIACGAIVIKNSGYFSKYLSIKDVTDRVTIMYDAMVKKSKYMHNKNEDKSFFLKKFKEYHKSFYVKYQQIDIDSVSLKLLFKENKAFNKKMNNINAKYIYKRLKQMSHIYPLFELAETDSPLYVPIIVRKSERNNLQQFLIENHVYLPIHWDYKSNSALQQGDSNLYDMELSLICDKRYDINDLKYMMDLVGKFDNSLSSEKEV